MIKIGKYEFVDEASAIKKIKALGFDIDEEENQYPTHSHAVIKIGKIIIENAEYDDEGNITKEKILSEKYHVDVMWNDLEDHPYGWKSYAVTDIKNNGIHQFFGLDYIKYKFD